MILDFFRLTEIHRGRELRLSKELILWSQFDDKPLKYS